jgi:hypothetical protein
MRLLVVDGVPRADALVIRRASDILVKETDLLGAQVQLAGFSVEVKGVRYVSLASLASHVTYRVDFAAIVLDLRVERSLLGHAGVAAGGCQPHGQPAQAVFSGFPVSGFVQTDVGKAPTGLIRASGSDANRVGHRELPAIAPPATTTLPPTASRPFRRPSPSCRRRLPRRRHNAVMLKHRGV